MKGKSYERIPDLPDAVNDCLELLLERIDVPGNCWPHMRMEVAGTWAPEDRADAIAWCTNGGPEPYRVFELRKSFARAQGIDPARIKRLGSEEDTGQ